MVDGLDHVTGVACIRVRCSAFCDVTQPTQHDVDLGIDPLLDGLCLFAF